MNILKNNIPIKFDINTKSRIFFFFIYRIIKRGSKGKTREREKKYFKRVQSVDGEKTTRMNEIKPKTQSTFGGEENIKKSKAKYILCMN